MSCDEKASAIFLVIIVGRKQKDILLTALLDAGIHLINTAYSKGTVNAGYLMNTLGLVPEKNKVVISCIVTPTKAEAVFCMLTGQFHFNKPNTGIAFTIPVDSLSF